MSAERVDMNARDGEWSVPEPPSATAERHVLTSRQRAELNRRLRNLPADIAAGRMRSTVDVFATIARMRAEQGGRTGGVAP